MSTFRWERHPDLVPGLAGPDARDASRSHVVREGDGARVVLCGELDLATLPEADRLIDAAAAMGGKVIVDLRHLTFMDASGIRLFVLAYARLGSRMRIVAGPPEIHRVFELTGMADRLPFVPD